MLKNKKTSILLMVFALIFCLLAAGAVSAADPPTANFTSNVTNGTGPLSVQFNDKSTGNVTSWNWDFSDSSTSTEQNPTHTYTNEGSYSVSLTAFNADGNNTITQNNYINVAIPPTVTNSLTGGSYNTTQTVILISDDPTATIYYASDTTDPRNSSTRTQYTGPITINTTTTLRYAAQDTYGNWSPLYLQNYVIGSGGLADTSWAKFGGDLNNTGQSSYVGPQTNASSWIYTTGGKIYYSSAVISADGTIYIGSSDGIIYAFNSNGTLKWNYTTGGEIDGAAVIGTDGTIYIGSCDSKFYAINPDGTLKWTYSTGGKITVHHPLVQMEPSTSEATTKRSMP